MLPSAAWTIGMSFIVIPCQYWNYHHRYSAIFSWWINANQGFQIQSLTDNIYLFDTPPLPGLGNPLNSKRRDNRWEPDRKIASEK